MPAVTECRGSWHRYDDNANATQPWDATFAKKPTDS